MALLLHPLWEKQYPLQIRYVFVSSKPAFRPGFGRSITDEPEQEVYVVHHPEKRGQINMNQEMENTVDQVTEVYTS